MDIASNKAVNADKRRNIVGEKELNTAVDENVDADKGQDVAVEPLMLIKDQIIRQIKLRDWIRVE